MIDMTSVKRKVEIREWEISNDEPGVYCAWGFVIGHPRYEDWTYVRTSNIKRAIIEDDIITLETKNTMYIADRKSFYGSTSLLNKLTTE